MIRKLVVVFLLVLVILAFVWIFMSIQNGQEAIGIENKASIPKVTYDDKAVDVYRGSYAWNTGSSAVIADALAPYDIIEDKNSTIVKEGDTLNFAFPYTPQKATVRVWKDKEVLHAGQSNGIITAPRFEGTYAIEIYAEWKEGHGIYVIKLEVEANLLRI